MKAMVLQKITQFAENPAPLEMADMPVPEPGASDLLVKVRACGVCHTELDEIEGRTAPPSLPVVPGPDRRDRPALPLLRAEVRLSSTRVPSVLGEGHLGADAGYPTTKQ